MAEQELQEEINRYLEGLSKEKRVLFVRRFWYMDSYEHLAKLCGCSEGTVRTRLSRIIKGLKGYLVRQGYQV